MATTRSGACDPTMSQGMWALWACYSKDGVRNNRQSQEMPQALSCVRFVSHSRADQSTDILGQGLHCSMSNARHPHSLAPSAARPLLAKYSSIFCHSPDVLGMRMRISASMTCARLRA